MGDMGDDFRAMKEHRRERRVKFGQTCPTCPANRCASILLPGQRCRVCGYVDPRDPKGDVIG